MKEHTTSGAAILAGSRSEVVRLGEEIAIRRLEGTQFAPQIVEAFATLDHASLFTVPPADG